MRFRPRSIRAKLLAVFFVAVVVPMGVLGLVFYTSSTRAVADMAGNRSVRIARQVQDELDRKLADRIADRLLVANEPVQAFLSEAAATHRVPSGASLRDLRAYFPSLFDQYGDYYEELILADTDGRPLIRYDRVTGAYVAGQSRAPYSVDASPGPLPRTPTATADAGGAGGSGSTFRAPALPTAAVGFRDADRLALFAVANRAEEGSQVRVDPVESGREPTVSIIRPVTSIGPTQRTIGYLLARLRSEYVWPEDLTNRPFGQQGALVIVNRDSGEILYHSERAWIGRRLSQLDGGLARAAAKEHARPDSATWTWVAGDASGRRVAATYVSAVTPWEVIVTATPAEFSSEAQRAGLLNLIVACFALLLAGTVLVLASGRLSRSIGLLTAGAQRIAGGDLAGPPIQAETHDEIETLADTFNRMTEALRRNIAMREEAAAELDALNRSLETRVHERTRELEALNAALNRANEDLKELDKLKSNFLATVSHEFKTPLTSIKAFAEILHDELEEQKIAPELRRFLKIIDSESDRLARLIKNVLDLSRIESGKLFWRMTDFPMREVVDATVDSLLPSLKEKQIRIERDLHCPGITLHGDADRIQEVLANILDNAIHASRPGGRIVIGCREEDAAHRNGAPRMLRVSIRDEGTGIPADQLTRIFDRFHQVATHGRRRRGGTGLGLAISREITEYHGGRIWAESEPGIGSTFHITLPIATEPYPAGQGPGGPAPSGGENSGETLHA